jgi:hypothetical protein
MVEDLMTELAVSERLAGRKMNLNVCYGWPISIVHGSKT